MKLRAKNKIKSKQECEEKAENSHKWLLSVLALGCIGLYFEPTIGLALLIMSIAFFVDIRYWDLASRITK